MYRLATVDDNVYMLDNIKKIIVDNFKKGFFQIDSFISGEQVLSEMEKNGDYMIYLLDIDMPEMNGLELAAEIRKRQQGAYIVFLTAYDKFAVEGYDVKAYGYVVKERIEEKLIPVLNRICEETGVYMEGAYPVQRGGIFEKLLYRDIYYIQKDEKNAVFITNKGEKTVRKPLKTVLTELPSKDFVMVERGYIVNLLHVLKMENNTLLMRNGDAVRVGRAHAKDTLKLLCDYVKENRT